MKLTFLGSGSAFTLNNFQSNMLLETRPTANLLIDCGSDARFSLNEIGMSYKDINAVYISHLHADHIGGLEWLGFSTFFDPGYKGRPRLYLDESLVDPLWDSLKGGMASIQGQMARLGTYFNVNPIEKNGSFNFGDIDFRTVQTVHIMNEYSIVPSFGLMWVADNGDKVFLTTDTQHCPNQIQDFYNQADIIFQDCETSPFKSGVHAHYTDLNTLDDETKAKMWLYHYQDGDLPQCTADGFKGFITMAQEFEWNKY